MKLTDDITIIGAEPEFGLLIRPTGNLEHQTSDPKKSPQFARIPFDLILINEAPDARHVIDFKTYHLQKGECMLISRGQVHGYDLDHPATGYEVFFTDTFLSNHIAASTGFKINWLFNYHLEQQKFSSSALNHRFVQALIEEFQSKDVHGREEILAAYVSVFLTHLERQQNRLGLPSGYERKYEIFESFRSRLEISYKLTRDVKSYANFANISYKHLNEICKSLTNKTAKEFVDDFIHLEAKRQLVTTSLKGKEIGYNCGFDEATNFLKYFKKREGITPNVFRGKFKNV